MEESSPATLAARFGHYPTAPTWPADTERPAIPMKLFGKDHWSTFAYVETRAVDHHGLLDHDHMRCHGDRHPIMLSAKRRVGPVSGGARRYPTRIKSSETPDGDGRYGVESVDDHDDYDCLDDLIVAGLLEPTMPVLNADGQFVDAAVGRVVSVGIDPRFLTGLDEKILATRAVWKLTEEGRRVAQELRSHKADGDAWHNFTPSRPQLTT